MDISEYPAQYMDEQGKESTTIRNDGERLYMSLHGRDFIGLTLMGSLLQETCP